MAFVCALSGEVPEVPVISLSSKNVFEKRLLEKYVEAHGKDPITSESMSLEDIIPLKSSEIYPPKVPAQSSIPNLLKTLQDEWDAFVLQNHTRTKQMHALKQELSLSLYQLDSSCRVIARLLKENEELRSLLSQADQKLPESFDDKMEIEEESVPAEEFEEVDEAEGLDKELFAKIHSLSADLTSQRKIKNRNPPTDLATIQQISEFKSFYSNSNLHSASAVGITAMDLRLSDSLIVTGGKDKCAVVFDWSSDKVVSVLKGHTKKVTHVVVHPSEPLIATGSSDTQIRLWDEAHARSKKIIKCHNSPITGLSLHPMGTHLLSSSSGQEWAFIDVATGAPVVQKSLQHLNYNITCCQIHPDGLIFGTGSATGPIKIWDFKECRNVVTFDGHADIAVSMAFSENGYYLASASLDSTVRIWDLRKTKCVNVLDFDPKKSGDLTCVVFDETGQYMAASGDNITVYLCKKWEKLCTLTDHTSSVSAVRFGQRAKYIASVSLDRSLRIYNCDNPS